MPPCPQKAKDGPSDGRDHHPPAKDEVKMVIQDHTTDGKQKQDLTLGLHSSEVHAGLTTLCYLWNQS